MCVGQEIKAYNVNFSTYTTPSMHSSLTPSWQRIVERTKELEEQLNQGYSSTYDQHTKEYAQLKPLSDAICRIVAVEAEQLELLPIMKGTDEMAEMASAEYNAHQETLITLKKYLDSQLKIRDPEDERSAIIEVRAGTGGAEAALFAGDLFRMYERYVVLQGWSQEIYTYTPTEIGGLKEASMLIKGHNVYGALRFESGVHRVQRVPKTENAGRVHTSAATVAVLPEAEEVDIHIHEQDLRIDVFRSSGPGGQSVNTTDSAVRITHIPTGLVVQQQDEKSQHKNKAKALKVLRSRLYELECQQKQESRAQARKSQIGTGDRSERIRTYNFPQGRVTDHRCHYTLHNIQGVMNGEIQPLIEALETWHYEQVHEDAENIN